MHNTDAKRHETMSIPLDIPPINPPEYQMEVCAPKWKEVEHSEKMQGLHHLQGPTWSSIQSVQECFRSSANSVEIYESGMGKTGCT